MLAGERRDPFEGFPDMGNVFYGIADYLSLWVQRHGFLTDDIVADDLCWRNSHLLTFKVTRNDRKQRAPISPLQYDPRLPDNLFALVYRPRRIRAWLAKAYWYRRLMARIDDHVRDWAKDWEEKLDELEVAPRWAGDGRVVLKIVRPVPTGMDPKRYMTHYRNDE